MTLAGSYVPVAPCLGRCGLGAIRADPLASCKRQERARGVRLGGRFGRRVTDVACPDRLVAHPGERLRPPFSHWLGCAARATSRPSLWDRRLRSESPETAAASQMDVPDGKRCYSNFTHRFALNSSWLSGAEQRYQASQSNHGVTDRSAE